MMIRHHDDNHYAPQTIAPRVKRAILCEPRDKLLRDLPAQQLTGHTTSELFQRVAPTTLALRPERAC